jgi:hypothetical protein
MVRRKSKSTPLTITLKDSDALKQYIADILSDTDNAVKSATRHGISNAVNTLIDKTRANIAASDFKSSSSQHYGVGLIHGARGALVKGQPFGIVHILGNRYNDGTYRLRFFEGGAKRKNRGIIGPRYFFKHAIANAESLTISLIQQAIDKNLQELQ